MDQTELETIRYPIGRYEPPARMNDELIAQWIGQLEEFPKNLSRLVSHLSKEQLDTPYRPDGWTIRQVVHHLADSHHNSYLRFKWALTEDNPTVKVYDEKAFAELNDSRTGPIQVSLDHLSALHTHMVLLLRGLSKSQLRKTWVHPVKERQFTIKETIGHYVWHGNHHYSHIRNLLVAKGWM